MNNTYSYPNYSSNPSGSVYQSPSFQSPNFQGSYGSNSDNRLLGTGFAFPFLLGGVTGAAIAPAFWRPPYNRPYYGQNYGSGPFYGPGGYGPYRPF